MELHDLNLHGCFIYKGLHIVNFFKMTIRLQKND